MILPGEKVKEVLESVVKVNPNGVDVAPKKIFKLPEAEVILDGDRRGFLINGKYFPLRDALEEVKPEKEYWVLKPGMYYVVFPKVRIPENCVGFAFPRTSLNRLGVIKLQTGVFDAGYEGEWTQTFYLPNPARINVKEAWVQFILIETQKSSGKYRGYWYGENY